MFNHDWFHHGGLQHLLEQAKDRCAAKKFPDGPAEGNGAAEEYEAFRDELETRIILYVRDGLTYEIHEMAEGGPSTALTFECVPVDDSYKVGAIVIVVPYDDIARVEVFAVHPDDKPQENFRIPGFRATHEDAGRPG